MPYAAIKGQSVESYGTDFQSFSSWRPLPGAAPQAGIARAVGAEVACSKLEFEHSKLASRARNQFSVRRREIEVHSFARTVNTLHSGTTKEKQVASCGEFLQSLVDAKKI
jgi:hypothetical protein